MKRFALPLALLAGAVPALAEAGPEPGATSATDPAVDFYGVIQPLVQARCTQCHSDDGVSFSLTEPEESYAMRVAMANAVGERRMPPWLAEPGHQEYVGDYSLSEEEVALFTAWAEAGYPKGEAAPLPPAEMRMSSFEPDVSFSVIPDGSYLPNQTRKDDYRCFLVDWPYDEDRYVTGFKASPGNRRVAHHLVNFVVGPEAAEILKTVSDEEDGQGYQCFGGAVPDSLGNEAKREALEARFPDAVDRLYKNNYWLTHWAPGMEGFNFPEGTGVLVRPGSVIVVQMHYYGAYAPGEADEGTAMHFKLAGQVDKPSINFPLTHWRWLRAQRNGSMVIPPGESATFEVSESFENVAGWAARVLQIAPEQVSGVELHSANVHMHAIGASGEASLLHASGQKETLLSIPRWDLNWQGDFVFTQPKTIPREEFERARMVVECTFTNPNEAPVLGGYGSDDEMCFNFSYVSLLREGEVESVAME